MNGKKQYVNSIKKGTRSRGQKELLRYLAGERLTRDQAIKAHCYDCSGFYLDGRINCGIENCPLHPFMPFRNKDA